MMEQAYRRWPDLHVDIHDMIAEGDKVVVRNVWRGTESATGKAIAFEGIVIWRMSGGKIGERWAKITPPKEK